MPQSLLEESAEGRTLRNSLRLMTEYGVFKFGDFTLKSGQRSPIYIDLRECFNHMDLMRLMRDGLQSLISDVAAAKPFSGIVGVPYAALPYASLLCEKSEEPLLMIRKEAKAYGTKKLIEGNYSPGQRVVVVEDVVTTGSSLKEVICTLRAEGLLVEDVFCLLDREQGGADALSADLGVSLHSLLNMEKVLSFLVSTGRLSDEGWAEVVAALSLPFAHIQRIDVGKDLEDTSAKSSGSTSNGSGDIGTTLSTSLAARLPLDARERLATGLLSKKILSLMHAKSSNLCIAIDYTTTDKILQLAEKAGPFVIAVKVHADAIDDFSDEFTRKLVQLANDHQFLIFEDRKFADTGATCSLQAARVSAWADVVTVHGVAGAASVCGAFRPIIAEGRGRLAGILLIAQLSTAGCLIDEKYTREVVIMAEANSDVVCGIICQERLSDLPGLLHWTPGVNLDSRSDGKGQQWRSVEQAIAVQGNDIVIVGRAITEKATPVAELRRYQEAAWNAFNESLPK